VIEGYATGSPPLAPDRQYIIILPPAAMSAIARAAQQQCVSVHPLEHLPRFWTR